jgi:hypothetical protein
MSPRSLGQRHATMMLLTTSPVTEEQTGYSDQYAGMVNKTVIIVSIELCSQGPPRLSEINQLKESIFHGFRAPIKLAFLEWAKPPFFTFWIAGPLMTTTLPA